MYTAHVLKFTRGARPIIVLWRTDARRRRNRGRERRTEAGRGRRPRYIFKRMNQRPWPRPPAKSQPFRACSKLRLSERASEPISLTTTCVRLTMTARMRERASVSMCSQLPRLHCRLSPSLPVFRRRWHPAIAIRFRTPARPTLSFFPSSFLSSPLLPYRSP